MWNYAVEFFDLMHRRRMQGPVLFKVILFIIQYHEFHCAAGPFSIFEAKKGNEDITFI